MSKLIKKSSEMAQNDIKNALSELRNCHDEIRKGLTSKTYADMAQAKLTKAIKHMLDAESWVDAIQEAQGQGNEH
ncbi:hypothetical protein DJ533_00465 (plasmid) [Acinetobacter defluvii]|uniref:Uncharacterized protein n=1 Tax=Acinetobacter defluvii TaxID=1871111 RepID=A0A2S2F8B4_9GAMM|nr:hypothetical protein [Acinetobacter defluvii]AWL27189.1 hypothetical protein DJ533_00465 [Acinetobacter defluvii]